jgi:hypothetical protein
MKEQNELLEAALKLADEFQSMDLGGYNRVAEALEIIERHRPKPNRLEGWLELNRRGLFEYYHKTEPNEFVLARIKEEGGTVHHLREVVPVEFEKWSRKTIDEIWSKHGSMNAIFDVIAELHNSELERIANA